MEMDLLFQLIHVDQGAYLSYSNLLAFGLYPTKPSLLIGTWLIGYLLFELQIFTGLSCELFLMDQAQWYCTKQIFSLVLEIYNEPWIRIVCSKLHEGKDRNWKTSL